jgi:hypothetical protein
MKHTISLLLLPIIVVFGTSRGYSQSKLSDGNGAQAWWQDTTRISIEDLFGRFRATSAATLDFSHSSQRSESYGVTSSSEYNSTTLSFATGNRGIYGLSASASNSSPNQPGQSYDVGIEYRPLQSLQASGDCNIQEYSKEPGIHSLFSHANIGFVRDGGLAYDPVRFGYYYYFSEILLGRGWTVASSLPQYSSWKQTNNDGSDLIRRFSIPISAVYGWSDHTTIGLTGTWDRDRDEGEHPGAFGSNQVQLRSWGGNEQVSMRAKINTLFSDNFLLTGSIEWTKYFWNWNASYEGTSWAPPDQFSSAVKDYGVVSATLSSLWLRRSVTVTDLRRSRYSGSYLCTKEARNQLQISYYSHETLSGELASAGDNLAYGIGDRLELDAGGSSTWQRKDVEHSMNGWDYSFGLTLHSLNFGGAELNDIEYFWGKITQPGDYVATLSWEAYQEMWGSTPRTRVLSARVKFALMEHSDVEIRYVHTYEDGFEESRYNNVVCNARWDVASAFRMSLSGSWSQQSITPPYPGPDFSSVRNRGLWAEITLQALL